MPSSEKSGKRPPFRSPPLPQAGDSGRRRMNDQMVTEMPWIFAAVAAFGTVGGLNAGLRLGRDFGHSISGTLLWIIFGTCLLIMGALLWHVNRRVNAAVARIDNEALGIRGEQVVAESIADLKSDGYRIFHSLPPEIENGGDFDHVVIGPKGVYVIETKTFSKRESGENEIYITREGRTLVNGYEPDRCPISQAKTLRDAMRRFLERETGKRDIHVRGVVIFPGWYINDRDHLTNDSDAVWTLHEAAFAKFLRHKKEPVRLSASDIALFAARIEDHVQRARKADERAR